MVFVSREVESRPHDGLALGLTTYVRTVRRGRPRNYSLRIRVAKCRKVLVLSVHTCYSHAHHPQTIPPPSGIREHKRPIPPHELDIIVRRTKTICLPLEPSRVPGTTRNQYLGLASLI